MPDRNGNHTDIQNKITYSARAIDEIEYQPGAFQRHFDLRTGSVVDTDPFKSE